MPAPQCGVPPIPYEPAVRLAASHAMTVNAGVIARRDLRAQGRYCRGADAAIDAVRLRDDTIYVVSESAAGVLAGWAGRRWPAAHRHGLDVHHRRRAPGLGERRPVRLTSRQGQTAGGAVVTSSAARSGVPPSGANQHAYSQTMSAWIR